MNNTTSSMSRNHMYIGIKGHVVCLRRTDGTEVWRQKLRGSNITTLLVQDSEIFASTLGYLYALQADTGHIKWENPLKGMGMGVCILGVDADG